MREINGSNVCVIGGCGFLGSHLVDYLIDGRSCNVLVLDNLIAGRRDFLHPKANFVWCDITQSEHQLYKLFKHHKIEYIENYAAIPYVPFSYDRPLHVFDINARAALMVMNAAQEAGVLAILQVSSAEIYGNVGGLINEEDHTRPHSTYGAAKLSIDAIVQTRWREAKCPAIALRQFNCLGERDILHPYIIPEVIEQALASDVVYLGNNTFRDFMYAGDAVAMAVELLEKGKFGEVYNLGSQEGIKIYDLAKLIGKIMGKNLVIVEEITRKRPWDINHLQSDNAKIYSVIERRHQVSFEDALKRTIDSYLEYRVRA